VRGVGKKRAARVGPERHAGSGGVICAKGRGELGLDPAEPGLRQARGHLPPERSAGGDGRPAAGRTPSGAEVPSFARPTRGIVPPGKTHSPRPFGPGYHERPGARGRTGSGPQLPQPLRVRVPCKGRSGGLQVRHSPEAHDPSFFFSPSQPSRDWIEPRASSILTLSAILIFTFCSSMSMIVP
jgi:hypothetical protein